MNTAATTTIPTTEQRSARRWSLKLPVSIACENSTYTRMVAQTSNLSARGVFLEVNSEVETRSPLELMLTLPPEITLTDPIRVRCKAKVVRVNRKKDGSPAGIAAAIEQYEILTATTEGL